MGPRLRAIISEVQLLVEGNDADAFFEAMIRHLSLENLQAQNFGGVAELGHSPKQIIHLMSWGERVVPLAVEFVSLNGQSVHLLRRHLPACLVAALVEFGANRQPAFRRYGSD